MLNPKAVWLARVDRRLHASCQALSPWPLLQCWLMWTRHVCKKHRLFFRPPYTRSALRATLKRGHGDEASKMYRQVPFLYQLTLDCKHRLFSRHRTLIHGSFRLFKAGPCVICEALLLAEKFVTASQSLEEELHSISSSELQEAVKNFSTCRQ